MFTNIWKNIAINFQINTKPASNKPNVGLQGPGKTTKQVSGCPQVSQVCIHLSDDLVIGFSFSFSQGVYSKTESPVFIMPWYATEFSMLIHPIGVESRHLIVILGISPNILLGLFDHSFGPDNVDGSSIRVVITNILHCICREDYIFGTNESPSIYWQLQISWEWTHPLAKG